ncbi:uncharacterized protein LOC143038241 [Oratosquilla oratoria]|uniref:uncharacterized protein LOC143038241 n=1 Tax=Oratosquilla oratoria TaxID=337810 RepID=UPI003F776DF5
MILHSTSHVVTLSQPPTPATPEMSASLAGPAQNDDVTNVSGGASTRQGSQLAHADHSQRHSSPSTKTDSAQAGGLSWEFRIQKSLTNHSINNSTLAPRPSS